MEERILETRCMLCKKDLLAKIGTRIFRAVLDGKSIVGEREDRDTVLTAALPNPSFYLTVCQECAMGMSAYVDGIMYPNEGACHTEG